MTESRNYISLKSFFVLFQIQFSCSPPVVEDPGNCDRKQEQLAVTQVSRGQLATVDITVNYTLLAYMLCYFIIVSKVLLMVHLHLTVVQEECSKFHASKLRFLVFEITARTRSHYLCHVQHIRNDLFIHCMNKLTFLQITEICYLTCMILIMFLQGFYRFRI